MERSVNGAGRAENQMSGNGVIRSVERRSQNTMERDRSAKRGLRSGNGIGNKPNHAFKDPLSSQKSTPSLS
jgi:hypothetical protein